MKTVILDTSFLVSAALWNIDVKAELDRAIPDQVRLAVVDATLRELDTLEGTLKGKEQKAAVLAKKLVKTWAPTVLHTGLEYGDDAIRRIAAKDTIVATQDAGLKRSLAKAGIPIATIRQQSHVVVHNL
ncbi:hypothetical protein HY642_04995 [Candidatus Woesearchaeota archaeon]|nr:hypothetical protein [Candidatus Woesearchaeota archaeon]